MNLLFEALREEVRRFARENDVDDPTTDESEALADRLLALIDQRLGPALTAAAEVREWAEVGEAFRDGELQTAITKYDAAVAQVKKS